MPRPFQIVCLLIFSSVLFSSTLAYSQTEGPAVVTFTIDFPTSQPEHYSIRVQSDGLARYQSSGRRSPDSDETDSHENDNFGLDFTVAAETRQKIFELAAKADRKSTRLNSSHSQISYAVFCLKKKKKKK